MFVFSVDFNIIHRIHPAFHKNSFFVLRITVLSHKRKFIGLPCSPHFYLYARQRSYALFGRVIAAVLVPCLPCPLSRAHRLRLSPTARSFGSLSSQSPPPHILSAGYSVVLEKTSPHSSKGNHYLRDIKLTQQRRAKGKFTPLLLYCSIHLVFVIVLTQQRRAEKYSSLSMGIQLPTDIVLSQGVRRERKIVLSLFKPNQLPNDTVLS